MTPARLPPTRPIAWRASAAGAPQRLARLPLWLGLGLGLLASAQPLHASCLNDEGVDSSATASAPAVGANEALPPPPPEPRGQLRSLVQEALMRNNGIGAQRLLAEAALQDVEEARASKLPQAAITGSASPALSSGNDGSASQLQLRAGLSLSQTLYDGGRSDRIVDWRRQQAESARLGMLSTQEQITLATTSLALERSRFRMQAVIYKQNVRKMGCLVEALETIAAADKGRTSELVQAKKQLQLAELQQTQAVSQARQSEAKLRRMVGDGLPGTDGLSTLLLKVPELPDVLAAAERSTDIAQLDANASALQQIARVVEAGTKPQVSWSVGANALLSAGGSNPRNAGLNAGMQVSIPLLNPAVQYSAQAANKRAQAALLQRAEVLESRRQRIVEVHEQAGAAFDRVRRVGLVLRDSERLRNFTLQQWQQLGRRSLFDVIAAESDHYNLRVQYANALIDGQQMNAMLTSLGTGLTAWLQ